jgi:RsiW-degrading membrane proteinase PrsW (M82 family)
MHYAAGVFWLSRSMIDKAIDEFVLDVEHEDSESIRHRVIHLCMRYERWDTLARLVRDDEKFRETLGPYQQMHLLAHTGQWWPLFKRLPMHLWGDLDVILIGISLGIGSFWFLFLLKATQPGDRWKQHTGLCLLALFLGVLSVWPTVFCIYFQEDGWGLVEGSDPASVILYYVLGVGLREELCKLLLVLPLVPIIAKPNNGLRMLLIPACVGLGFAIEENMQYYDMSMMADVTGRFVSANVFHFMLTGMAGMELCWFWLYPKQRWQNFLGTFALVVLLHGGYDAVITLTEGDSILGMGSIAILILITYQFFRLLREYRKPQQSGVSQVFVYVMGVCVSAMVVVYYQTWVMGLSEAFNTLADELLFMGIMSVLFLREIPTVLTD